MGIEEQILDITFKEGKQEGLQEGKQEGLQQGIEQGARGVQLRTVREALQAGLPLFLIQKLSGLPAEEIGQLRPLKKSEATLGIAEQILDLTFEEGKQLGLQEGKQQGVQQGIEQGARGVQLRTASEALRMGLPLDLIQKLSGLSADEIVQLREG